MPVDWNLASGSGGGFSALEALQSFGAGRTLALADADRRRADEARGAMTDYLLAHAQPAVGRSMAVIGEPGNPEGTPSVYAPPSSGNPLQSLVNAGSRAHEAYARLAQADPEAAMRTRRGTLQLDADQLEVETELNSQALQVLSSVRDQATYEAAIAHARNMLARYGRDSSALDRLPAQYSPETINGVRMELMTGQQQLAALRDERKLEWDIEDDVFDNERADRNTDSMIGYRQGQLSNTRRGQDLTHSRGLRGQDIASGDRRRGQDMTDARGRRGQDLRGTGTGRGRRGGGGGGNSARAMLNGRAIVVRNNRWVYEDNGQAAQ